MKHHLTISLTVILTLLVQETSLGQGTVTDLRSMGYAIFPAPQQVSSREGNHHHRRLLAGPARGIHYPKNNK